ncbi:MAG: class I SAM-dependent methyltransferase [Lachnospiraceae bacterium]|nr:class I SAM-dependent methyltransferase [Lachnospiraceae bacterium]MDD3796160.1 class I SAM-dependent methyltransferase [Lachnospiraceae bacterium]
MEKKEVIEFFDRCAPTWDATLVRRDDVIKKILDNGGIKAGLDVLDVACGTGVLFPYYLQREVNTVTGIDISPEMAKIAGEKYSDQSKIRVICGDVEETSFDRKFDAVMVYNAFPHFQDAQRLIGILAFLTKEGGRLTIAHGMSRDQINSHHKGTASGVSKGLMCAEDLQKLFEPYFDVDIVISDDTMYQVSGKRA